MDWVSAGIFLLGLYFAFERVYKVAYKTGHKKGWGEGNDEGLKAGAIIGATIERESTRLALRTLTLEEEREVVMDAVNCHIHSDLFVEGRNN